MNRLLRLAIFTAGSLAVLPAVAQAPATAVARAPAAAVAQAPAAAAPAFRSATTRRAVTHRSARSAIASGTRSVTSRNPVSTAAAVAERFWGATPCAGQIKIVADSPMAPGLLSGTDGWVTFNSSLGPDRLDAPASTYTNCTISLAHWQWASWTDMESDWGMFCLTMTHEMGHLLGYKHTLRPGSVMNPVFTNQSDVPAACNSTWLPGWRYGAK
jgi:Matrixin